MVILYEGSFHIFSLLPYFEIFIEHITIRFHSYGTFASITVNYWYKPLVSPNVIGDSHTYYLSNGAIK